MASSLNKAMIMGNLGTKPELRYTQNSTPVTTLRVATHERWGGRDGSEGGERTEWHNVVVFGRQAETCCEYLDKGRGVFIEGRIQTREWEDRDGNKRYTTEIVASNVQFLSNDGGTGGGGGSSSGGGGGYNQSYGGGNSGGGGGSSSGGGFEPAFDDDDIPF